MTKKPNAEAFLKAMALDEAEPDARLTPAAAPTPAQPGAEVHELPKARAPLQPRKGRAAKPSRAELKHFGGYVNDETLEKIALLRVRLKKDNSELIVHAIDELHRKHTAKRAFGDA
ncbi:hypothetical protein [Roseomonas mucosa]|uniref:hypothetical protein n=1 Tax=Roseomonas mucosa TaxID=207340 RepID=UPI0022469407|nr:hypothetical protein [Roseomonas mucosa]UZO94924.1 Hypothetical protein RMP42_05489 [Roseomonas mucosa]